MGRKKYQIGQILRKLCEFKGVQIHEAEACPDHIHMLVSIPPKMSVSGFMGYLKGKIKHHDISRVGGMQNSNIEIESFGVEDTMWTQ